jgi:hypothetical protein
MMISFDRGLRILSQQSWLDHPLKCRLAFRSFYVPPLVFTIPNPTASVRLLSPSTFLLLMQQAPLPYYCVVLRCQQDTQCQ